MSVKLTKEASCLLGHTSIRTTAIYADLPLTARATAVNRLSDTFN